MLQYNIKTSIIRLGVLQSSSRCLLCGLGAKLKGAGKVGKCRRPPGDDEFAGHMSSPPSDLAPAYRKLYTLLYTVLYNL